MSEENSQNKKIYQQITEKAKHKEFFSALDLKTLLNHLIKLPEVYKLDFVSVLLPEMFEKCVENRDNLLYNHYKHYVSIPCLSALLTLLHKHSENLGEEIIQLLDHIKNLQLQPGPSSRERELLEQLQFDVISLSQKVRPLVEKSNTIDLRDPVKRKQLAALYYDRILKSFISEDDDNLVSEEEFIGNVKNDILRSAEVQSFASQTSSTIQSDKKTYLKDLGGIINSSIMRTYLENYKGIFNGDKEFVLKGFEEIIENRFLDHEDGSTVEIDKISTGILALTLELVFNSSLTSFKNEINQSIYQTLKEEI